MSLPAAEFNEPAPNNSSLSCELCRRVNKRNKGSIQQRRKRARTSILQTQPPNETYSDDERYETDNIHIASPAESGSVANSSYTRHQSTTVEVDPANNLTSRGELLTSEPGNSSDQRATASEGVHSPESHTLKVHDLSFILHPSHEPRQNSHRDDDGEDSPISDACSTATTDQSKLNRSCNLLGISQNSLNDLIDLYFANMTSFSLFRPHFRTKILAIPSSLELSSLLASMFSFSVRFCQSKEAQSLYQRFPSGSTLESIADHFRKLSIQFLDEAFEERGEDIPTLCILQALTLTTFQQLIKGARGRAWRSLGTCVRIAYELKLHLIDSDQMYQDMPPTHKSTESWCFDEEKRRTWWAIWEMDTFGSTVRRCPTAIDWSQNETRLPTDDDLWFRGENHKSCFLDPNPITRWKTLQQCGNQSPKAWFIVVNSLMREAQQLSSSPRAVLVSSANRNCTSSKEAQFFGRKPLLDISRGLGVIENSLQCFCMALPPSLRYYRETLEFPSNGSNNSLLMHHCSIYGIHIMIQLTRFMMYQHAVFGGGRREHCQVKATPRRGPQTPPTEPDMCHSDIISPDSDGLSLYAEAAEEVLMIITRSSGNHIHYVNPFLSSTVWLAAAVQLVYKYFGPLGTSKSLTESKFEVLQLNYTQFVNHWKMSANLLRNLEGLETTLKRFHTSPEAQYTPRRRYTTDKSVSTSYEDLLTQADFDTVSQPGLNTNQPSRASWIDEYPRDDTQNAATSTNHTNAYVLQPYQQQLELEQYPTGMTGTGLSNDLGFGNADATFDGYGFDLDVGTGMDWPGYINEVFSSGIMA
ncbi:hypothetical protein OIDMADRAFT_149740 [Oidiodendron maius Zn]|uniref:Xylanolytic transcriptional activator regulatory domain-containing protein n=1 Tax=Oidiodendron maius (strain Zn) TaxID=913774 RepID=A0A0C3GAY9_OIDMZ|nr:hypothetical protein OIDMADRAFT_149740 [Oidiodendron maius Zn]